MTLVWRQRQLAYGDRRITSERVHHVGRPELACQFELGVVDVYCHDQIRASHTCGSDSVQTHTANAPHRNAASFGELGSSKDCPALVTTAHPTIDVTSVGLSEATGITYWSSAIVRSDQVKIPGEIALLASPSSTGATPGHAVR